MKYILITRQLAEEVGIDVNDLELFYRKTDFDQGSYNVISEVYSISTEHPLATWILLKYPELKIQVLE